MELLFTLFDSGGWREWSDGAQTHVVPATPTWSAQCCDHAGSSNAACPTGMSTPPPGGSIPVTSQSPGTGSPATIPTNARSCRTCQSRGSVDSFYPFRPPGALFNPFFPPPPFLMHPQLAAAGFPFPPPGLVPEQFLGSDSAQTHDCALHRPENGVAAAAAMQYQNESESSHCLQPLTVLCLSPRKHHKLLSLSPVYCLLYLDPPMVYY